MQTVFPRACAAFVGALAVVGAHAATVSVLAGDPNWASSGNSGGGSSAITSTQARSGNGSLELTGDRTRFVGLGNPFSAASNLGLLNDVSRLTFEWSIALASLSALSPDYTPSLRLHVWDGAQRSELIWEGANNGTYGMTSKGVWYGTGVNDRFSRFQTGLGITQDNAADVFVSLSSWQSDANSGGTQWFSDNAYVSAISVGVGSSVGNGYRAFADNVRFAIGTQDNTYNFETPAAAGIPEPTSLALVGLAIVGLAFSSRRKA